MNLGIRIYMALGKIDEACRLLEENDLSKPKYLNLQAVSLIRKGHIERAKALLEEAYAKNPRSPEVLNNLGNVKLLWNEPQAAKELHIRAAQANPFSPTPRYNLVLSYQACGESEKALSAYYDYRFIDSFSRWAKVLLLGLCVFGAAVLLLMR